MTKNSIQIRKALFFFAYSHSCIHGIFTPVNVCLVYLLFTCVMYTYETVSQAYALALFVSLKSNLAVSLAF